MKMMVIPALVLILVAGTAVGMVSDSGSGFVSGHLGNYQFGYNYSESVLSDLSYTYNGSSMEISSSISVESGALFSVPQTVDMQSLSLRNATLYTQNNGNIFSLVTKGMHGNVSMAFNGTITQVSLQFPTGTSDAWSNLLTDFSNQMPDFKGFYYFRLDMGGSVFYMFSNVEPTVAVGADMLYMNSSTSMVIMGFVPFPYLIGYNHEPRTSEKFSFNSTSGQLSGVYMSLILDQKDGNLSDFFSVMDNSAIFSNINVSGNSDMAGSMHGGILPLDQPVLVGSLFLYERHGSLYVIHDNPSLQSAFIWSNGTANFTLSKGLNATVISTPYGHGTIQSQVSTSFTSFDMDAMESNHLILAGTQTIYINGTGISAFLLINNANVTISDNSILLKSNGTARATFLSPPGLQGIKQSTRAEILRAIEDGSVAAEVSITGANVNASVITEFNSTMSTSIVNVSQGSVTIHVSSTDHIGTDVLIFVSDSVIRSSSKITLKFDNVTMTLSSVSGVLNATTSATYTELQTDGGVYFLVHIPHFSDHTITISSSPSSPLSSSTTEKIVAGVIIVGVLAIAGVVMAVRRKK